MAFKIFLALMMTASVAAGVVRRPLWFALSVFLFCFYLDVLAREIRDEIRGRRCRYGTD